MNPMHRILPIHLNVDPIKPERLSSGERHLEVAKSLTCKKAVKLFVLTAGNDFRV